MSADYAADLAIARRLALHAGTLANAFYTRAHPVDKKKGGEPVTRADVTVNNLIVDALRPLYPDDIIVAEESPLPSGESSSAWIIDPIDGTREFLAGTGHWAVHIGRVVDGEPVVGVVFQGARHRMLYGAKGIGGFVEEEGTREPLRMSETTDPSEMRMAVSRAHRSKRVMAMVRALGVAEMIPAGGVGIKCGLVATGDCDVYLHPSGATSHWDSAAPDAILRSIGGVVTDLRGTPLSYEGPDRRLRLGIACSNGRAHDRILELVKPVVDHWQATAGGKKKT